LGSGDLCSFGSGVGVGFGRIVGFGLEAGGEGVVELDWMIVTTS
jgi:hypothetical protein